MADFKFNTDLSYKPVGQTSIGDMINMARGVTALQTERETQPAVIEATKAKSAKDVLTTQQSYADIINQSLGALAQDPDILAGQDTNAISKKIIQQRDLAIRKGVPREQAEIGAAHLLTEAYKNPASISEHLGNIMRGGISPTQQISNISGQQTVGGTDISGNPTRYIRDPNTGRIVQAPLPIGGAPESQLRIQPGETATTVGGFQDERNLAKSSAQAAAPALANIQAVRKYLPLASTGKYSEAIAGMQSVFGNLAGSSAEEKAAAARDIVEKSIADLGLQKNAALGNKFAADLSAAQQSLANAGKNPTAIAKSMDMLEPLIQHAINYQQGLENSIAKRGIQSKRAYDNAMIDAYDPQAMMIFNAVQEGDQKRFDELTKGMSESKQKSLGQKMKKYQRLISGNL